MSNLRPAPMFLRPSVVRQLINDTREIRKGMAQLQMLPVRLVDQPMPSALLDQGAAEEITRFETTHAPASNDHDRPAVAQEVAHRTERSDALEAESAPPSSSADCSQHAGSNPVPANPDPVEAARTGGDSEPAAEMSEPAAESEPVQSPFTCNGAALDWPDAPLPEHADPDLDRPEPTPADDAGETSARPKKKSVRSRLPVKESGLDRMAARESVSPTQRAMATAEKRSPILPLSIEERRRRLDLAIAHLKRQCILVDIVDRSAPIRTYRVSGKRESKLAEEVIEIAVARGLELAQ